MHVARKERRDWFRILMAVTATLAIGVTYAMAVEIATMDRFLDGVPTFRATVSKGGQNP